MVKYLFFNHLAVRRMLVGYSPIWQASMSQVALFLYCVVLTLPFAIGLTVVFSAIGIAPQSEGWKFITSWFGAWVSLSALSTVFHCALFFVSDRRIEEWFGGTIEEKDRDSDV